MAILFDLDGVFYQGDQPLPGAAQIAQWVRQEQIPHLFLTNTTSRSREALVDRLARFSVPVSPDQLLTPAVAAAAWCREHLAGAALALFVPEAIRAEFREFDLAQDQDSVGAVIIGDLGKQWDFQTLNRAFAFLMQEPQPQLVALGMTRYWQASDGLRLDVAPFVVALQHASGVEPLVAGKPSSAFFRAALAHLKVAPEQAVMVGDDIRSDIQGAQQVGMRAVLMRTGKFRESDLKLGIEPDQVLQTLADLPDWYRRTCA